ncbi:MAG: hypothetical protein COU07_02115 [Candidatus Harrisonbacteria bacterium CG10_big_fil_rev_8_21_14_0_10_40_38]|uniref:Phosphatidic acid phosphatase type 2/haloperoxidase domain-containing protein n=1 Tax=Candidatus Harrisonbacteria bacterium CG10_big_fil_rev_8_21_14_0_10_40_38 TaxID=1974583 RepID=A0A2H0UUC2_9BACT|nr:MAG: hypothetical protein COU07_02115 [Candidatus Harrisonbacteria bacterium CG10_big_fil_rev_8_21_14_0_10_40_38]
MSFDISVFEFIHNLVGSSSLLDIVGIFFASYLPYFILIGLFVAFMLEADWRRRIYSVLYVSLSILISRGIFIPLLNLIFPRERPFQFFGFEPLVSSPSTTSFPSGHTAVFFAVATAVFFLRYKWGIALFVAAFFIGVARIFVGVHWPTDILGGILVGLVSGLLVSEILIRFDKKKPVETL